MISYGKFVHYVILTFDLGSRLSIILVNFFSIECALIMLTHFNGKQLVLVDNIILIILKAT